MMPPSPSSSPTHKFQSSPSKPISSSSFSHSAAATLSGSFSPRSLSPPSSSPRVSPAPPPRFNQNKALATKSASSITSIVCFSSSYFFFFFFFSSSSFPFFFSFSFFSSSNLFQKPKRPEKVGPEHFKLLRMLGRGDVGKVCVEGV